MQAGCATTQTRRDFGHVRTIAHDHEIIRWSYGFAFRWPTFFGRDFLSLARYAFKRGFGLPLSSNVIHPPPGRGTHTSADDGFGFFIDCAPHGLV
jgi:hypothetical protein